jgi:tetratricopeptide (TPR) repeat protein
MTGRLIAVVLLLLGAARAQIQTDPADVARHLRVRIEFGDARCDSSTRVALSGSMGFALPEGSVDGECRAEFFNVPAGRYRVTVRGADATNADEGDVEVNPVISQDVEVRAKHIESNPANWATHSSFISVKELEVPKSAAKEFVKANHLIAKGEWAKAGESLRKGLAVYPQYAAAYNNLGAVYYRLGNRVEARQALGQAIALDDHLVAAYLNLGRLCFLEQDYLGAESLLAKAVSLESAAPPDELFLLAYAQLSDRHLDQAIQTSRQAHEAGLSQHGFLHLVAANAYEQLGRIPQSIAELESYLNEEPNGAQAEKARKVLAIFQARTASPNSFNNR